ncbi:MAG: CPBP family intramembrane glutamic endopeptidase [Bradyrhizobium sp.]
MWPALLIIGPYFLNKLIYIYFPGFVVFEVTDYACRAISLGCLYLLLQGNPTPLPIPWRLALPSAKELLVALVGTIMLIGSNVFGIAIIRWLNAHSWRLTSFPSSSGSVLQYLDNTLGMALVGLSEEAAFRFYLINLLLLRGSSTASAVVVSTLTFAAIHWSYGAGLMAFTAFAGLVLSIIFLVVRNLAAPVIAHAAYDAFYFSGGVAFLWRTFNHA